MGSPVRGQPRSRRSDSEGAPSQGSRRRRASICFVGILWPLDTPLVDLTAAPPDLRNSIALQPGLSYKEIIVGQLLSAPLVREQGHQIGHAESRTLCTGDVQCDLTVVQHDRALTEIERLAH